MREIDLFESWINSLSEGTVLPTTTQKQQELIQLLSQPFPVGADATNAVETLHDLFMDPELSSDLSDLAETDPNADARPVIMSKLSDYKNQPGIATVMAKISNATANGEQPAPPTTPGSEEAVDATAPQTPPAPEAPPAPAPQGGEAPAEEPVPDEMAPQQPVAEEEDFDYDADLKAILKHAGVEPCGCPAEDYLTGSDPHLKENRRPFETRLSSDVDEGKIAHTLGSIGGGLGGLAAGGAAGMGVGSVPLAMAGGAAGSAAGGAALDAATEKALKTDTAQSIRKGLGNAATWLGQKTGHEGWGQAAKGAVDLAMTPDSDEQLSNRLKGSVATDLATGALGGLGKVAQGAKALGAAGEVASGVGAKAATGLGAAAQEFSQLSPMAQKVLGYAANLGTSKTLKAGTNVADITGSVYDLISKSPNGPAVAKELLDKGWSGLQDPKTREQMMGLAGAGMTAAAGAKAAGKLPHGIKGAAKTAASGIKNAMGSVGDKTSTAIDATKSLAGTAATAAGKVAKPVAKFGSSFNQGFNAGMSGRGLPVAKTPVAQPQTQTQPTTQAPAPQAPTQTPPSDGGLAKTATMPQGHSAVLNKDQTTTTTAKRPLPKRASKPMRKAVRTREGEEFLESSDNWLNNSEIGLSRLITLAGINKIDKN